MLKSVTAAVCLCAALAQARSADLSGAQIQGLVAGATVEIDTPVGTKLPVRYGRDGKLMGKAGGLAWYLGTAVDRGRWWVASGQLCHKWRRWFNSEPKCMRLSRQGRTIRWRNGEGYSGTARISVPPRVVTAAVAPPAPPMRAKGASEASLAPARAASPARERPGERQERASAGPAAGSGQPPGPALKEAPPPRVAIRPAPRRGPPLQRQAETRHATRLLFKVANVRSDDVLNVRSGPSADFAIVGTLPPGSHGITITSACRASWCPVQHRATRGWVHSAYLAPEEAALPPSAVRASAWRSSALRWGN